MCVKYCKESILSGNEMRQYHQNLHIWNNEKLMDSYHGTAPQQYFNAYDSELISRTIFLGSTY